VPSANRSYFASVSTSSVVAPLGSLSLRTACRSFGESSFSELTQDERVEIAQFGAVQPGEDRRAAVIRFPFLTVSVFLLAHWRVLRQRSRGELQLVQLVGWSG
jgi:hypothetical protein